MSKGAVRRLIIEGSEIEYELIRKRIRNIYFSVKGGGKVLVSAPASVPICYVEKALMNRWPNIRKALDSQSNTTFVDIVRATKIRMRIRESQTSACCKE